jgi:hypothetical protein
VVAPRLAYRSHETVAGFMLGLPLANKHRSTSRSKAHHGLVVHGGRRAAPQTRPCLHIVQLHTAARVTSEGCTRCQRVRVTGRPPLSDAPSPQRLPHPRRPSRALCILEPVSRAMAVQNQEELNGWAREWKVNSGRKMVWSVGWTCSRRMPICTPDGDRQRCSSQATVQN